MDWFVVEFVDIPIFRPLQVEIVSWANNLALKYGTGTDVSLSPGGHCQGEWKDNKASIIEEGVQQPSVL